MAAALPAIAAVATAIVLLGVASREPWGSDVREGLTAIATGLSLVGFGLGIAAAAILRRHSRRGR